MNFLFHVGVGNKDRPERWEGVCHNFSNLANSLEKLGHNCIMFCHSKAKNDHIYHNFIISDIIYKIDYKPDYIVTWNGISEGDQEMRSLYPNTKFIYCELGFFDHYNTCYFDLSGTNATSMNVVERVDNTKHDQDVFNNLVKKYKKSRLFKDRYIFVPFQDERDTQITKNSSIKSMSNLIDYVINLYAYDDNIKILYKQHPHAPAKINSNSKLIEVKEDVHHYIPYAENVIGINSTVLFETLLYHQRLLSIGLGIASRRFETKIEREKWILNCYNKQINSNQLMDIDVIENSWIYKKIRKV